MKQIVQNLQQQKNFMLKNTIKIRKLSCHLFKTKFYISLLLSENSKMLRMILFWRIIFTDDSKIYLNMQNTQ